MQHPDIVSIELFSLSFSLKSRWCCQTIVLTWIQLRRIPILFYQPGRISILSITCEVSMLTSLLVDEVLLPRYVYLSTIFIVLSFNVENVLSYSRNLLYLYVETNVPGYLLQTMQQ